MENTLSLSEIFSYQLTLLENIVPTLYFVWDFFWAWGWIVVPFLLWPIVTFQWLFWRNLMWADKNTNVLLEVKMPEDIEKPIRAMELAITGFWQIYGPANWHEKWWEGQFDLSFALEIACIEGTPHFLVRCPVKQKGLFEQHIYAQYPDAEIYEVEDYAKRVPQNIPNSRWEMWGTDYTMPKSDCYPLKTYRDFETENEKTQEQKVDPIAGLLEGLSQLGEGEQMWIQIKAKPITDEQGGFQTKAKKEYERLAGRKEPPPPLPLAYQITNMFFGFPKMPEKSGGDDGFPAEMKLTPGERATVESIEKKRTKHIYSCFIRYIYLARKENLNMSRIKGPMSYFNQFNNPGLGFMVPFSKTITKIKRNWWDFFWMRDRRLYLRKRKMFRNYVRRENAFFPLDDPDESFVLSSEELATLYHFPSRGTAPSSVIPRIETRRKEAPHNLPVAEDESF